MDIEPLREGEILTDEFFKQFPEKLIKISYYPGDQVKVLHFQAKATKGGFVFPSGKRIKTARVMRPDTYMIDEVMHGLLFCREEDGLLGHETLKKYMHDRVEKMQKKIEELREKCRVILCEYPEYEEAKHRKSLDEGLYI